MTKIINRVNRCEAKCERSKMKGLKVKWLRLGKMVRNNWLGAFAMALSLVALTACDGHRDFPDTSMKVGDVVCTDGRVMTLTDATNAGKEPIAVVFHVNNNDNVEGRGYAVYLKETPAYEYADSIGVAQGTSADIYALDGNINTYNMYASRGCGSPVAEYVFDMWRYGQSAYIPSVAQMRLLDMAKSVVNPVIAKCGGEELPDDADNAWFWTSTEVDGQQTVKAWLYSLASGAMQETPKTQAHKARPIITIND